jgi:hypothetical protein
MRAADSFRMLPHIAIVVIAILWSAEGLAQAPQEREIQLAPGGQREMPLEVLGIRRPEIAGLRISAFLVGSFSYNSHTQIFPEFAAGAPTLADPGSTNFRFDKFGLSLSKTFAPWLDVNAWVVNRWESENTEEEDFNDNNRDKSFGGRIGFTPFPRYGLLNIGIGGFYGPEQDDVNSSKRWVLDVDFTWTPLPVPRTEPELRPHLLLTGAGACR